MANHALFRPQMTGPQPVAGEKIKRQDSPLLNASDGVFADRVFAWAILACAVIVLAILVLIVWQLVSRSQLSWHAFGWTFFWGQDWDPVSDDYGALPFAYGTLVSSLLALMVIPVISSSTREVLAVVAQHQREAALALGATRWEMIRIGVLRNARAGIVGGIILGLGRALGETMAVTMVIGNRPEIAKSLFAPGYTLASVIANEFAEAPDELYKSALIEIGLALFIVTIIVNACARLLVWSITRGVPARVHGQ